MTESQQVNLPWPVIGAAVTGAVSVVIFVVTNWRNSQRERLARSREVFSRAYVAVQEYKEFPYVIRRRRKDAADDERVRISSELRRVQSDLAFYSAWLRTESSHVHRSYAELLEQLRLVAGGAMREAWLEPPIEDDSGMNMPDLGLSALASYETAYLDEVVHHLAFWPRWFRRIFQRKTAGGHNGKGHPQPDPRV